MVLTLYYTVGSPSCHQVLLTARALNLDVSLKHIDWRAKENMTPEYIKMNLEHTVPTLVDDDFVLWESRAISRYLVNKYGAGSSLYPQDPRARAVVDQRLDFDLGTLYRKCLDCFNPVAKYGTEPDQAKLKKVYEALELLDQYLEMNTYVAGAERTIADFACVANVSLFDTFDLDYKSYLNIVRWFEMMKKTTAGYEDLIQKNVNKYTKLIKQIRNTRKQTIA